MSEMNERHARIRKHLGAILDEMCDAPDAELDEWQRWIDGLSETNCWFAEYDAREFLRQSVQWAKAKRPHPETEPSDGTG